MYIVIADQLQVGIINIGTCPDLCGARENICHSIFPQGLLVEADTVKSPKGQEGDSCLFLNLV